MQYNIDSDSEEEDDSQRSGKFVQSNLNNSSHPMSLFCVCLFHAKATSDVREVAAGHLSDIEKLKV